MTTLTAGQAAASIAVMALVTFLTRALPFLLFDRREKPPELVIYLGQVLPPAIITMLIVYCLRGVSFGQPAGWCHPFWPAGRRCCSTCGRETTCCPFSAPRPCICCWSRACSPDS